MSDEEFEEIYKAYKGLYQLKNNECDQLLKEYGISEDEAYRKFNIICQYYYNEQLDPYDKKSREDLFTMADLVFRYRFLNENLEQAYVDYFMKERDNFLINHFEGLLDIIEDEAVDSRNYAKLDDPKLAYMSPEKLEPYFRDFLMFADKTGEYLEIFDDLKKQGRLIYLDSISEEKKEMMFDGMGVSYRKNPDFCWHDKKFGYFVFITRENTINDFRKLAHEFTHYVSKISNPNKKASIMIDEFPSIFYELLAVSFLTSKGYTQEEIQNCALTRLIYVASQASVVDSIGSYLRFYIQGEDEISYQDDLIFRAKQIEEYKKQIGDKEFEKLQEKEKITPDSQIDEFIKYTNSTLSANPGIIAKIFPYIIGYHLSKKFTKKSTTKKDTLVGMKYITKHLPSISSSILLKELDKDKGYAKTKR